MLVHQRVSTWFSCFLIKGPWVSSQVEIPGRDMPWHPWPRSWNRSMIRTSIGSETECINGWNWSRDMNILNIFPWYDILYMNPWIQNFMSSNSSNIMSVPISILKLKVWVWICLNCPWKIWKPEFFDHPSMPLFYCWFIGVSPSFGKTASDFLGIQGANPIQLDNWRPDTSCCPSYSSFPRFQDLRIGG